MVSKPEKPQQSQQLAASAAAPPAEIDNSPDGRKKRRKLATYAHIKRASDIVNFKGRTLQRQDDGFYWPLSSDDFSRLMYGEIMPGASISEIREMEHMTRATAPDMTHLKYSICFGGEYSQVWDMESLEWRGDINPDTCVLASRITPADPGSTAMVQAWDYVVELANGDKSLADDMLQAIAPLFMARKPAGVIWFVGGGANGKSALVNAIYRIIGHHLASMTVSAIEDGRDTPRLNGVLGNVCRESSEGKVEDSERYKAIGTHEPFYVHKFHSQEMVTVEGDLHHIFNANNIPIFSDKTEGARRRTLIIPFNNKFAPDPTFEDRTFTDEFLGGLLTLILQRTHTIRDHGYQYKWSDETQRAKADYDSEVNSAEAFLDHLRINNVAAFSNYRMLRVSYENWCGLEGLVPLGITNLKRVMHTHAMASRQTVRLSDGRVVKRYYIDNADPKENDALQEAGSDTGIFVGSIESSGPKQEIPVQKALEGF